MELRPDGINLPKAMVIPIGNFQTCDAWHDEEDGHQWYPDAVVRFQSNAWVDRHTHIHGLTQAMGPMDEHLEEDGICGVCLDDNL